MPRKNRRKYLFKRGKEEMNCEKNHCHGHSGCGIYFVGFIGAAVYYIQQSATFWQGVVGLLKALVWPAFLVYKLLGGF